MVVQGTLICVDLFLLPMDGTKVVLGIQWLKTLGKITTDYSELSMEFLYEGKSFSWTGEEWIDDNTTSTQEMKRLSRVDGCAYFSDFRLWVFL